MTTSKRPTVRDAIARGFAEHIVIAKAMDAVFGDIEAAAQRLVDVFRKGNRVFIAGNGGSAADAQHWTAEWVVRLDPALERPALPVMALSTDTSILTAASNDIGFDNVFARQVEAYAREGDLVLLISTSGRSENLLRAARMAREKGAVTVGLLGKGGGTLQEMCDHAVVVPSDDTQHIQEMHEIIGHLLCRISEEALFGAGFESSDG